jgi:hypothetical protein
MITFGRLKELTLVTSQASKAGVTDASPNRILSRTIAVSTALVWAIANTTIFTEKGGAALTLTEPIAHAVGFSWVFMVARNLALVVNVWCQVVWHVRHNGMTAVLTNLLVGVDVVITKVAWTSHIAAVTTIVTCFAKTTSETAFATVAAVSNAAVEVELPHISRCIKIKRLAWSVSLFLLVSYSTVHQQHVVLGTEESFMTKTLSWLTVL